MIIGAGPAGEAAAHKARALGASVAVVDRRWFGGSCPHIGCVPSKSLLHGAAEHPREPRRLPVAAGLRRGATTWSTGPPTPPSPTTRATSRALEAAGAVVYRGEGRITGRGRVAVTPRRRRPTSSTATNVVVAVGSIVEGPADRGLDDVDPGRTARRPWPASCPEPARPRRRPDRLRARPGLRPVRRPGRRSSSPARASSPTDHPRNSEVVRAALEHDGVDRADRASARCGHAPGPGPTAPTSSTSTTAPRPRATRSCSPSAATSRSRDLGLEHYGLDPRRAGRRSRATAGCASRDGLWVDRRPGRPRAAHAPGPLPGRARGPDGPRRARRARLPGAPAGDVHRPGGGVRRVVARPGDARAGPRRVRVVADFAEDAQGLRASRRRSAT